MHILPNLSLSFQIYQIYAIKDQLANYIPYFFARQLRNFHESLHINRVFFGHFELAFKET